MLMQSPVHWGSVPAEAAALLIILRHLLPRRWEAPPFPWVSQGAGEEGEEA